MRNNFLTRVKKKTVFRRYKGYYAYLCEFMRSDDMKGTFMKGTYERDLKSNIYMIMLAALLSVACMAIASCKRKY